MLGQERDRHPSEPAPESWSPENAPQPEEGLSERLSEMAESVTGELKDLRESLESAEYIAEDRSEPAPEADEVAAEAAAGTGPEPLVALSEEAPGDAAPQSVVTAAPEGTSDDRLLSALAWLTMVILQLPIVSIIQLLSPTNKERPLQKHHAVTSLLFFAAAIVYEIVAGIAYFILGLVTLGIGFICLWVIFFVPHLLGLYYALQAYNGRRVELPVLSDLGRSQGWM